MQIRCKLVQVYAGVCRNTSQMQRCFRVARLVDEKNVLDGMVNLQCLTCQGITVMYSVLRAHSLKYLASTSKWRNSFSHTVIPLQTRHQVFSVDIISPLQCIHRKLALYPAEVPFSHHMKYWQHSTNHYEPVKMVAVCIVICLQGVTAALKNSLAISRDDQFIDSSCGRRV